ncbi:hypothetical protein Pan54_25240 [Rubinisphaera italica]|uniref:Uncharacterized protein n=1 Tax=Rubinisphaera italica TaxID=2527969 RepID=A0A5C5XFF3_9PLAN|nr:hypothetical protein Pan54_25240 [Rubinisphaera italica]
MSTEQMPQRDQNFGRQPESNSNEGENSLAFLITYSTYFVIAAVVITLIVIMTR